MSVYLNFLLILTGLTGIHSITTVSEVSVKTGGSISIPCLYGSQYRNHVKYLCKGYYYSSCSYAVKTNQQHSGKFSISDDKSRRIFTVTINDLTNTDTHYWCFVEINNGTDNGKYFHLSVTRGTPSLYVDHQEVTGTKGGNVTINCYYNNSGEMKWCKLGGSCVKWPTGFIDGTTVTINASVPNVFTVTMSGLSSNGWYYCVKGDLQMPVHVTVTTRIHSITTVSDVSVKSGASISIPCLYGSQYRNHVKYLCKGTLWISCSTKVRTDTQGLSGKFSISDDKIKSIFTVTIKDLTDKDTDYYWCAVEIEDGLDVKEEFHLSVTGGTPRLYVDHQEVTGFKREKININCYYRNSGEIKWCKLGSSCVTKSAIIDGTTVTVNASVPKVFTVTMSGLRTESSGWYYCVKGDLQMPVHVTVHERPTIALTTVSSTLQYVTSVTEGEEPTAEGGLPSPFEHLKSFSIRLSVLILVVMVTLFIWFIVKRYKQAKVESSATEMAEGEVRYRRRTAGERSHAESGDVEEL